MDKTDLTSLTPVAVIIVAGTPFFHAVGDAIRVQILGGFTFGYDEERSPHATLGIPQLDHLLNRG